LIACITALAGCMKIYPDPELPDIEVEWYDGDCGETPTDMVLTLTGVDDTTVKLQTSAACSTTKATFKDVPRQRYKLQGSLFDDTGEELNRAQAEIDLRNGIDEHADLWFGSISNFRVDWTFDMDATCASLGVDFVQVEFSVDGEPRYGQGAPCPFRPLSGGAPKGVYTLRAYARDYEGTILAVSPEVPDLMFDFDTVTDVGTLVLTPCGDDCP
jgi:hypothetical protein